MADDFKNKSDADLQKLLESTEEETSALQNNISSVEKSVKAILQQMFKQSYGDPNAKEQYTEEVAQTLQIVNRQLKLNKDITEKLVEKDKETLKQKQDYAKSIKDEIKLRDELKKKEEEHLAALQKNINTINSLVSGNFKEGISGLLSMITKPGSSAAMYGQAALMGISIANNIMGVEARNNKLSAQLGLGYDNIGELSKFRASMLGFTSLSEENQKNYADYLTSNFNINNNPDLMRQLVSMRAMSTNAFQGRVQQSTMDSLLTNAIRRGQITNEGMAGQLTQNLAKSALQRGVSEERFARNLSAVNDAVAQYGVGIETTGGLLAKFGKEVDKGTISIQQMVAVQSGIANGNLSQNAGLGALLMQSGNLPKDALKFAGTPFGLSGWLRNNAFRSDVVKGVESTVRSEAKQAGLSSPLEMQEYFKMRYSTLGYNISNEQAAILGKGGSLSAKDWKQIENKGKENENALKELKEKATEYYNKTSTPLDNITDIYNLLANHWFFSGAKQFKENFGNFDANGNVVTSSEASVGGFLGFLASSAWKGLAKGAEWATTDLWGKKQAQQVDVNVDVSGKVKAEVNAKDPTTTI